MQGAVIVKLKGATDLAAADANGHSDPFVKFELNSPDPKYSQSHQSTAKHFTLNPEWDETFEWYHVRASLRTVSHPTGCYLWRQDSCIFLGFRILW